MINERGWLLAVTIKGSNEDVDLSINELRALAKTAGIKVEGQTIQALDKINPKFYIGRGKIEEVKDYIKYHQVDTVIVNDDLSPNQIRNLSDALDCIIIDRSLLILDIFAMNAKTGEGMLQVELAQLSDRLTRLTGQGISLSRLGGGIGTRGPGEKKLETDRRHIRKRLGHLRKELKLLSRQRNLTRDSREKRGYPLISIVGYTNAGKSSLLNKLTNAGVLVEDKLFATLDTTTRKWQMEDGRMTLISDTVGFIEKLPTHLVEAFHSTLEEVSYADLLIHVVDGTSNRLDTHLEVVYQTLSKLGASDIPVITAFNKMDIFGDRILKDTRADETVKISVKTGQGLDDLIGLIDKKLKESLVFIKRLIAYTEGEKLDLVRRYGNLLVEDYRPDGIYIEAYIDRVFADIHFTLNETSSE